MKKLITSIILFVFAFSQYSCNDEIDYEQFEKFIYLNKNGWQELNIEISKSDQVELPFAVSVNGTLNNDKNVNIELMYDAENLDKYNFDKYRYQEELYYTAIPTEAFLMDNNTVTINANEIKSVAKLGLDIGKISDKYKDYILPLSIKSTSEYKLSDDKYRKGLFHINFVNSYSGNYTGDLTVYLTIVGGSDDGKNDTKNKQTVSSKTFFAVSHDECYFYAGQFGRQHTYRDKFIVNMKINEDNSITLSSPNSELDLRQESATIKIQTQVSPTDNRYNDVTTIIDLKYTFRNLTDSDKPKLRAEGKMQITKQVLRTDK